MLWHKRERRRKDPRHLGNLIRALPVQFPGAGATLLAWWIGVLIQVGASTISNRHGPFSIYNTSQLYISIDEMFAQQESQGRESQIEEGGEREGMAKGREERERGGGGGGGGEEFLRLIRPTPLLLKCQLLSSWLAQFHSRRARRRTRSSHAPFLVILNQELRYY